MVVVSELSSVAGPSRLGSFVVPRELNREESASLRRKVISLAVSSTLGVDSGIVPSPLCPAFG